MVNKLTPRHSYRDINEFKKYILQCPCCGTIMNFGKNDVYKSEDDMYIHHEYIDCPECNESIQLSDEDYFGY